MRKIYPSDISREQFQIILPLLEGARKQTSPRKTDLYDVFCAVLYVLDNGCTWRAIPGDFPNSNTVYYYFKIWKEPRQDGSLLEQALKKIGRQ